VKFRLVTIFTVNTSGLAFHGSAQSGVDQLADAGVGGIHADDAALTSDCLKNRGLFRLYIAVHELAEFQTPILTAIPN